MVSINHYLDKEKMLCVSLDYRWMIKKIQNKGGDYIYKERWGH